MAPPILTLLTDFGLKDHYVGTMKGVILSRCPDVQLIDLSHEIPPFSLHEGAYALAQSSPFFPDQSIHLVVIDPGVGSNRRAVVVEANRQLFVAPDNGVLSIVLQSAPSYRAHEITNRDLFLPSPSSTFHGRDVFAPVAAALASRKIEPSEVGPEIDDLTLLSDLNPSAGKGLVLSIDHFGNVITSLPAHSLKDGFVLQISSRIVTDVRQTFAESPPNHLFLYLGSSGYVEVGINQGRAADLLGVRTGDPVYLRPPQ